MSRRIRAALVVAAAAAGLFAGAAPATALDHGGSNPSRNIAAAPGIGGSVCDPQPDSSSCRSRLIDALNHARHVLGLPSYSLPDRFAYLTTREKMLVLVNQDRAAYGLSHVYGMNSYLNTAAQLGVAERRDPGPVASVAGHGWSLWTANWAGGTGASANGLYAHYNWMYYDGLNPDGSSWNLACHTFDTTLCWKHRDNVLVKQASGQQLAIGIGAGSDGHGAYGFTHLMETFPTSAAVNYIPSVVRESSRWAHRTGNKTITLGGFGFVRVTGVYVLGAKATVVSRNPWSLTIRVPAHAPGKGHVVVTTAGGTSAATYAAAFTYVN